MGIFSGIKLKDFANFAEGAIERDKQITKENLIIRAEELKANRDSMLKMKENKYNTDIKNYQEERKKANEIQKLNAVAASGNLSSTSYAKQYLLHSLGTEKFNALQKADPPGFLDMVDNLAAKSKSDKGLDYKFTLDRNSIDNQNAIDNKIINKGFADAIQNAKGDSFLINKLLRKKSSANDNVNTNIEEQLKAAKILKEDTVDKEKGAIEFTDDTVKRKRQPPEPYKTAFDTAKKTATFKSLSDKDNLSSFIGLSKKLGFGSEMNFKFDNKDSKIVGVGDSANAFLETYKKAYDNILNSYTSPDLYAINKNRNSISSFINEQEIKRQVENMMIQRENVLTTGEGFNLTSNKQLMAIIPLNIVDTSNRSMINGKPVSINIPESNKKYNEFLKMKAKSAYGTYEGDVGIRNLIKVQNVLENDKFGNGPLSQELKKVLVIEKPIEDTSKNNVPPKPNQAPKSKIQITSEGLLSDRGLLRWESPQIQNKIDSLTPTQKKAYDEWKAKGGKNNTKTKSSSNPSYMRPAKPDIITPKVKEFMQDTKKTEGEFGSGA
tara:strand:- start:1330 stop:2982 length:1653 start_codon:yes stop_codon:yes gene_type:complete